MTQEWAKAHPDELSRYLAAILKAEVWIYDPTNKQALFEVVHDKLNLNQATFDQTYQNTVVDMKLWLTYGHISDGAIVGVLKGLVDLGALKEPLPPANKYYDTAYLTAALNTLAVDEQTQFRQWILT